MDRSLPPVHPTVVHMLRAAVAARPGAEALVFADRRLSYREYGDAVSRFAAELAALGAAGERVATLLPNSIEACVAAFAIPAAGAQHVPLNPLYTARELGFILADAEPLVLVTDVALADFARPLAAAAGIRHCIVVGSGTAPRDGHAALPLPGPDSLALLQYTGGTTGHPKGVNLTHRALSINVSQREGLLPTTPDRERILCVMPLFHSYAMAMGLFLAAYCRGTLVILPRFKAEEVLAAVVRERITIFPGSPTIFVGLMSHPQFGATDWRTVHTCYSGSAALPEETLRRWEAAVGAPVYEGYGQTEAGPVLTFNPAAGTAKPGAVGIPVAATEIQIVDTETGTRVLPRGKQGEIRACGPQLMTGYRNRPEETATALREGWLYTGDIGELDADGYLWIRDRKKDMAIVGGYNVYPREIDDVLTAHPDVAEAATIGVPDAFRGEVIRAWVVLRGGAAATADDLLAWCRDNLARYKVPVAIDLVAALPRTRVGKIDKQALRAGIESG